MKGKNEKGNVGTEVVAPTNHFTLKFFHQAMKEQNEKGIMGVAVAITNNKQKGDVISSWEITN